jgi:hypothetical protein
MNGGWQTFSDASGRPFANEGLCIDYAIHHPVSLADLASAEGGFGGTVSSQSGCAFSQVFNASSQPASTSVGTVALHVAGCLNQTGPLTGTYAGSFTLSTNVGSLSGSAAGSFTADQVTVGGIVIDTFSFGLTLNVQTGTGLLDGTTGSLNFSAFYTSLSVPTFRGFISLP